jgi:gas vesicle protein
MSGILSWLFGAPKSGKAAQKRRAASSREQDVRRLAAEVEAVMTPERRELIRRAMEIRKNKSRILADLGDEEKRKLYALAVKNLLHESDDPKS